MHTPWRRSSYTSQEGGTCVELAQLVGGIGIRDSMNPAGPVIHVRRDGFASLLYQIRSSGPAWRTSSYTGQEGGTCVELAILDGTIGVRDSVDPSGPMIHMRRDGFARLVQQIKGDGEWRKSRHSTQEGGACVEVARLGGNVGVRDSVDPGGTVIRMRRDGLARLFRQIKTGNVHLR